jgi:transcription elongation factor Elf1
VKEIAHVHWDHEGLWQKAKLYAHHATASEREGSMFPFWATLSLEFLARATLSSINPCLLADPTEGDNLLYACGFPSNRPPVSIKAKTVFLRCQRLVPNFTEEEFKFCMSLVQRRNEELHTSAPAFEDFPTKAWLARFFRVCSLLLAAQRFSLADLFGETEARAASEMVNADEKQNKKEALDLISAASKSFKSKAQDDVSKLKIEFLSWFKEHKPKLSLLAACPACGEKCLLFGERIGSSEPRLEDDKIVQETAVLPTKLRCPFCGLRLESHALLHGAELGGQYSVKECPDPVKFHGIDPLDYFDPADYYDADYNNE